MPSLDDGLYHRLNRRMHIDDILEILYLYQEDEGFVRALSGFLTSDNKRIRDNAAWVMTHFDTEMLERNKEYILSLKSLCMETTDTTMQRLLLTVFERLYTPQDTLDIAFLNYCLDGMGNPSLPVGTRALCMKLAWRQCRQRAELKTEMLHILRFMERETDMSPAVACVRNRILGMASSRKSKAVGHAMEGGNL